MQTKNTAVRFRTGQRYFYCGILGRCLQGDLVIALLALLDSEGICASAGSACSTGAAGPSHVLIAMGISPDLAGGSLRLTISDETTAQEADFVADTVIRAVKKLQM